VSTPTLKPKGLNFSPLGAHIFFVLAEYKRGNFICYGNRDSFVNLITYTLASIIDYRSLNKAVKDSVLRSISSAY
jgi:hypothetical protein